MTQVVDQLEFPVTGFLETRRGDITEVGLSNVPTVRARTYVLFAARAGEIPAGIYSTGIKARPDGLDDEDEGWSVVVELEPERGDAAVRRDVTLGDEWEWEWDEFDLAIVERREELEWSGPPPEREGEFDLGVDPFGPWALDEEGRAFRIEFDIDDESGMIWLHTESAYGASLHPGVFEASVLEEVSPVAAAALAAGEGVQELQLFHYGGFPDEPDQRWRIGRRRAIEAAASSALPDFDPGEWMRWLTPVDGGDPVACDGFLMPGEREIQVDPLGSRLPEWAAGRVLTVPMQRPGETYDGSREVTLYGKPYAELSSSVSKIRKRPPVPLGRFVLESQGYMPSGWSALG